MVFNQSFFRLTPETFQAIDIDFAVRESPLMVNHEVLISTEHKGILTSKLVRVNNASSS